MPKGQYERRHDLDLCCPHGHPWDVWNIRYDSRGSRICVICRRDSKNRSALNKRKAQQKSWTPTPLPREDEDN